LRFPAFPQGQGLFPAGEGAFVLKLLDHPIEGEEEKNLLVGFDAHANLIELLYNRVVQKPQFLNNSA
jgi:hypothetical protein